MRKVSALLAICIVFTLLPAICAAQTWHTANQVTVAWDPVAKLQPTDTISYQVYTKFGMPTATPQAAGAPVTATQQTISFSAEGRYFVCVESLRLPQGETEVQRSARMACSDVATDVAGGATFGVKYFIPPADATGIRLQP
jgi:hypothetical protein